MARKKLNAEATDTFGGRCVLLFETQRTRRKRVGGGHLRKILQRAKPKRVTLHRLGAELIRLRKRVGDLEDLRGLSEAIARNEGKPGTPWEQAKKELGL